MADVPKWRVQGDWFDTCNCSIPCPCTFAQPPTTGDCEGILAWHIRKGNYGDVRLDGLSVMALGAFKGNHLGRADEGVDGDVHRRTRRRATSAKRCR